MHSHRIDQLIQKHWDDACVNPLDIPGELDAGLGMPVIYLFRLIHFLSMRNLVLAPAERVKQLPCELFLSLSYCDGSPSTQMGGRPYRPAGIPWPAHRRTGQPMEFVGQFCFDRTKEQFSHLPGDLLLFFIVELSGLASDSPDDEFRFEWYELPFAPDANLSNETWNGHTAVPYPSYDVQSEEALDMAEVFLQQHVPDWDWRSYYARHLLCFPGVKIGGAPAFRDPEVNVPEDSFLLSLSTCGPPLETPFPWIDTPTPIALEVGFHMDGDVITARDGFLMNLYYDQGTITREVMFW